MPDRPANVSVPWVHNEFCYGRLKNARRMVDLLGAERVIEETQNDASLGLEFRLAITEWIRGGME